MLIYSNSIHDKSIVEKANSLNIYNFCQINVNTIRFDSISKRTGLVYSRRINIFPYHCECSTFIELAYCHHLLAINRLGVSKIVIYPN